jgi:hypothetical protein
MIYGCHQELLGPPRIYSEHFPLTRVSDELELSNNSFMTHFLYTLKEHSEAQWQ